MASVFAELFWLRLRVFTRCHVRWRMPSVRMFDRDALCKHIHTPWVMLVHHSSSPKHPCNAWMLSVDQELLILIFEWAHSCLLVLELHELGCCPCDHKIVAMRHPGNYVALGMEQVLRVLSQCVVPLFEMLLRTCSFFNNPMFTASLWQPHQHKPLCR